MASRRGASEEPPSVVGYDHLTITTAKQKQYDFCRQVLNLVLQSVEIIGSDMPELRIIASVPRLN